MYKLPEINPGESWHGYQFRIVNNLFLEFPLGREPFDEALYPETGYHLALAMRCGKSDIPHGQDNSGNRSPLMASKTPREFNEDLLRTTESLGIDLSDLCRKLNGWYFWRPANADDRMAKDKLDEEVCKTLIRIFCAMLELGYNPSDLRG